MAFVKDLEAQILDFVDRPENNILKVGTGSYSTPFRGSLFGENSATEIDRLLQVRQVELLWLGSNPSVRSSLANILASNPSFEHFDTFKIQMQKDCFSQCVLEPGGETISWNPIQSPKGTWRGYHGLFQKMLNIDSATFANFFLWGSGELVDLRNELHSRNESLWRRILDFCNDINRQIVERLKPNLMVIPISLGRSNHSQLKQELVTCGISENRLRDLRSTTIQLSRSSRIISTGYLSRGSIDTPVAMLYHPSSMKFSLDDQKLYLDRTHDALYRAYPRAFA